MNTPQHVALFSGQVAVLVLLALVLTRVLRAWLTPRARCWIWGLVVLRLCLPVSLDAPFSLFNLLKPTLVTAGSSSSAPEESVDPSAPAVAPPVPSSEPTLARLPPRPSTASDPVMDRPVPFRANPPTAATPSAAPFPWARVAVGLWALGAIALLARTAWLAWHMHRAVASGVPCISTGLATALDKARHLTGVRVPIRVVVMPGIASPALYGFLRPTLLVPPDLEPSLETSQLRHVLLHECAHVRRRDIALNWLMALLQALHWFNPAVWLAFARLRAERELACDEIALEASGKDESEAYGRTLLHLLTAWQTVEPRPTPGAIGLLERRSDLRRRLRHIADFRPGRRLGLPVALLIAMGGAVTLTDAQSPPATNATSTAAAPTNLPPVVPLRYTNAFSAPENKDLRSGGNWAMAPRGSNVLGGVHFEVDGLIQLASKSSVEYKRDFREFVTLPLPTNRYGAAHLLASAAWSSEPNRRIADVIWRYDDGTAKRSSILYTGHVRDWWRRPFEEPRTVFSKFAKCAVTWSSPDAEKNKAALRAYRVTLANPEPTKPVAFIQLQSTMEKASLMVLAVSMDPLAIGQRPDPSPDREPEDPQWTRHLGVTVIDAGSSNVVGGAKVKASVATTSFSADREYIANGSGIADVLLPEEGLTSVTVEASAKDYSPTRHRFVFSPTNPAPAFAVVRLHGGATLGGVVLSKAGDPIEGVEVEVARFFRGGSESMEKPGEDSAFMSQRTRTGADGRWEVSSVPKDRLNRIMISFAHDSHVRAAVHGVAVDAAVEAALLEKRHEMRLQPAIVVTGAVLDPEGKPVPNAEVRVGKRYFENTREGKTDATGRFRIGGQAPGETVVTAHAKGLGAAVERLTITTNTPEVTLTLKRGRIFSGVVTDAHQQPLADVRVASDRLSNPNTLQLSNEYAEFDTRTAADGTWSWDSGPDIEMTFQFQKEGYGGKSGVAIQPGKPATVVMNQPREVEGVVLDAESGEPVKEFRLEPRGTWWVNNDARSFTDANGRFTISLRHDHYDRFHVTSPNHEPLDEPIPAAVGGVVQMTIRLKPGGDWSGVVVDAAGRPVAGATVALAGGQEQVTLVGHQLESWAEGKVVVTGADGSFKLIPGQNPGGVVASAASGFGYTTVEEFQQTHRIRLMPFGTVEGTYRGRVDDDGMARITLQMTFEEPGMNRALVTGNWGGIQNPIQAGSRFSFAKVPAGKHQLVRLRMTQASHWEHRPLRSLHVESGQTTTADIDVEGVPVVGKLARENAANDPAIRWSVVLFTASRWKNPWATPEEMQKLAQDPEFVKAMQERRLYPCEVQPDGSFESRDGVPKGEYDLGVMGFVVEGGKPVPRVQWTAPKPFTVPEGTVPDGVINLGPISVPPATEPGK